MNPELKAELDNFTDTAREHIERDGEVCPVAFLICPDGINVVQCRFEDDRKKEMTIMLLRELAKDLQATTAVVLCEAWTSKQVFTPGTAPPAWNGVMPSQDPERSETIIVHVEEPDGYWLGMAEITRDEKGKATFGAVEYHAVGERDPRERLQNILPS